MKTKSPHAVLHERWATCRTEANRILERFQIQQPECGFHIGMGWMPIVEEAFEKMVAAGWDKELAQVKQKFCGLRIYIGKASEEIIDIIHEAEKKASEACEDCGKPHGLEIPRSGRALCQGCKEDEWKDCGNEWG